MLPQLLCQLTPVRIKDRLEDRIVHDLVRIQLIQIFLIKLQRRLLHVDGISDLLICLEELPELVAYTIISVLDEQVCPLYRTAHLRTAVHQLAEWAVFQRHCHTAHTVDAHEDIHIVAVIFGKALQIFDGHLDLIVDLFVCIVYMTGKCQPAPLLISRRPENHVRTLVYEADEALDEIVDEAVFVQIIGILDRYIQYLDRADLAVLCAGYELCILAEMAHALGGYALGERDRDDLLIGLEHTARIVDDLVYGLQRLLYRRQPPLVHDFAQDLIALMDLIFSGTYHGEQVPEVLIVLQGTSDIFRIFQIQIVQCRIFFHVAPSAANRGFLN